VPRRNKHPLPTGHTHREPSSIIMKAELSAVKASVPSLACLNTYHSTDIGEIKSFDNRITTKFKVTISNKLIPIKRSWHKKNPCEISKLEYKSLKRCNDG
jgi:hypothetical protein